MKRMLNGKRLAVLAALALALGVPCPPAAGQAPGFTQEQRSMAQAYQDIVVIGRQDGLPVEGLYDGEYIGVMPQFYQALSGMTGLRFIYLDYSGDGRYALAANQQGEILSMVTEDDAAILAWGLIPGPACFTYGGVTYRIAYTQRMPQQLIEMIDAAVEQMPEASRTQSAIAGAGQLYSASAPGWMPAALAASGALCAALLILLAIFGLWHRRGKRVARDIDPVTGLYSREGFDGGFAELREHRKSPLYMLAYILIDCQRQQIYFGDDEAARRLQAAAEALKGHMKPGWFAARADGFSFLLCFSPEAHAGPDDVIPPILDAMEERMNRGQGALRCRAWAGVCRCDSALGDLSKAIYDTRIAAHCARERGARYLMGSRQLVKSATLDYRTAQEILASIDTDAFLIYVLPLVNLKNGRVVGGQALVRWKHPSRGLLMPGDFLPFIEGTDKIKDLDFKIFEQICAWSRRRRQGGMRPVMMTCNLSAASLNDPECHMKLTGMMREYGVRGGELGIEIDSKILKINAGAVKGNIERMRRAGAAIILDNFGSDETSLCALAACPVDLVKLYAGLLPRDIQDRQGLAHGLTLLANTIRLCRKLGIRSAGTGVESAAQHTMVYRLGCDLAEGYHYYRPMPCDEFDRSFPG